MILFCIILITFAVSARVLVVVESGYYNNSDVNIKGQEHIDRYMQDVQTLDGKTIEKVVYTNISGNMNVQVEALWKVLLQKYNEPASLEGVVLVGNLPVPIQKDVTHGIRNSDYLYMEMFNNTVTPNQPYSQSSSLATIWKYNAIDEFYEHSFPHNSYPIHFEIWVSRIMGDNLKNLRAPGAPWGEFLSSHEIVSRYFDKVHDRMTSPALMPSRAMAMGHIEDYERTPAQALAALRDRNETLAFSLLPVDTTFYIYNFDSVPKPLNFNTGDYRINTASNWQSQLQAGPFGNKNKGLGFGIEVDNRYSIGNAPDSAPALQFDPSDTLGYEWVGYYEHGWPNQVGFNAQSPYSRGSFFSTSPKSADNYDGVEFVENGGYKNNGYSICSRDAYDSVTVLINKDTFSVYNICKFAMNWTIQDPLKGNCGIYIWVDPNMLPTNKRYEDNTLWVNYEQIVKDTAANTGYSSVKTGAGLNLFSNVGASACWVKIKNLTITDTTKVLDINFTPFLEKNKGIPYNLQEVLPLSALKIVDGSGDSIVSTVNDDFFISGGAVKNDKFSFEDRHFAHMQDDGGQSKAHFFLLNSCDVANTAFGFDNLNMSYAMGHAGLISMGTSTTNWVSISYTRFNDTISAPGKNFGDAYLAQVNHESVNYCLFGAGTLKSRPYKPFNPTGNLTVDPNGTGDFEECQKPLNISKMEVL